MRVLITGATGLLGAHLIKQAIRHKHEVFTLYRTLNKRSYLTECVSENLVHIIQGDVLNTDQIAPIPDIDVVIHAAALASPFKKDFELMQKINIQGTKNLANWAKNIGAKRFIQVSSIACYGDENYSTQIDESYDHQFRPTYYAQSKKEADTWLKNNTSLPLTIIHPCYMLGPYDSRPSSGSILFAIKMKRINRYLNNTKNIVHVSDVADGIFKAIHKNVDGNYILGGDNVKIQDFIFYCAQKLGLDTSHFQTLDEDDLEAKDDERIMREFCLTHPVSWNKAAVDFNYRPLYDWRKAVDDAIDFFCAKKMLRVKQ